VYALVEEETVTKLKGKIQMVLFSILQYNLSGNFVFLWKRLPIQIQVRITLKKNKIQVVLSFIFIQKKPK